MSIKNKCNDCIKEIGGLLKIKIDNKVQSVTASLQSKFSSNDQSDSLGYGVARLFDIYICYSEVSEHIKAGDYVYFLGDEYKITRIEPITFANEVLYYQAQAELCREGVLID